MVRSLTMRRLTKTFCGPRVGPCLGQRRDEPVNREAADLASHLDQIGPVAVDLVQPIGGSCTGGHCERLAAGAGQREADLGITERQLRHESATPAPLPRRPTSGTCGAPAGCRRGRRPRPACLRARRLRPPTRWSPPLTRISVPLALPRAACAAGSATPRRCVGSASPRNPSVTMAPRSSARRILLVA